MGKYYCCDRCGARIEANELRYMLKMNIFAAYDTLKIEHSDLKKDYEDEIRKLIEKMEQMDPKELEEDVFKKLKFDLCRRCHRAFLKSPLGGEPADTESVSELPPFDVDDFLRQIDDD